MIKSNVLHLKNRWLDWRVHLEEKCVKNVWKEFKKVHPLFSVQSCSNSVRNSQHKTAIKKFGLNKTEENELRQIIEIVIEEFQDHFGQALNLSIKQMTQHLLSNIHLFYNHYQHEFEQLTKKYRLAFLERFIQLMNKFQISQIKPNPMIQKSKPVRSTRVIISLS